MPLSGQTAQPVPGSSRKRTYGEITKSESRSPSPFPSSKRRRTNPTHRQHSTTSPEPAPIVPTAHRFVGDGLDFRRPTMSASGTSQRQTQETIDLTLDDDDTPPPSSAWQGWNISDRQAVPPVVRSTSRAPPFQNSDHLQVIDLSAVEDEDDQILPSDIDTRQLPSSPEIQFIRERVLAPAQGTYIEGNAAMRLPTPPRNRRGQGMLDALRGQAQFVFGNLRSNQEQLQDMILHRINGLHRLATHPTHPPIADTNYDDLQMNYGMAAFNMGLDMGGDLHIEDPPPAPAQAQERDYKAPASAKEGYTRTYEEDDMLVCGLCGDELATGDDEVKLQVWVIKQCGHVYCGGCATSRPVSKAASNRDPRKNKGKKPAFKSCPFPGCGKAVDSKTKMFQIYL